MKRIALLATLAAVFAAPAGAINDPNVPGDDCAPAQAQAVGHPAITVLLGTPAGPLPGPGNSDQGLENNPADPPCKNG